MSVNADSDHQELVVHEPFSAMVGEREAATPVSEYVLPDDYLALANSIGRIETLVDAENHSLIGDQDLDLEESAYLKGRAMLELDKAGKAVGSENLPSEIVVRLQTLQEKLNLNMKLLTTQLDAVQEVSGQLSKVMKEQESDGTYEALAGGW